MLTRKLAALTLAPAALCIAVPALAAPAAAAPGSSAAGHSGKVWVCKYVHTPGAETEVLKPGKQPIAVHASATAGELFNDAHGRSLVVDAVTEDNTSHRGNAYTGTFVCPQSPDDGSGDGSDDGIILN